MKKILNFLKNNKLVVFLLIIFMFLSIISVIVILKDDEQVTISKEYHLQLFGSEEITITEGSKYIDPGYVAYLGNKIVTNEVVVSGNVDINEPGNYIITYTIKDKTLTRKVIVLEKELKIDFKLLGEDIVLNKGEEYIEPGFIAIDEEENDYSEYVVVTNQINIDEVGIYYVIYRLEYEDEIKELKRKVEVIEPLNLEISYDKDTYKQEVEVKIIGSGSNFSYIKLPNQVIKKEKETTYKIKENGNYMFYVYDTNGNFKEEIIEIKNIDKEVDKASCILNIKVKSSNIKIEASDISGIKNYEFNGVKYTNSLIDFNYKLDSASVTVYDNTGNKKTINCSKKVVESVYGFILIGDSRFVGMNSHLGKNKRSNDTIIAKSSMGYKWLVNTAIGEVNKILKNNPNRKYYIMSNLGVNDYNSNYASKLNQLAKGDWKEHIVGYISVNPYASVNHSKNKKITEFNNNQKKLLNGVYYCDTYNGVGVSNFKGSSSSDVLHYNKATSIKVYNYIINNCNF